MRTNVKCLIKLPAKIWLFFFLCVFKKTAVPDHSTAVFLIYELKQFFLMRSEQIFVDRILDTVFDQSFRIVFQ